MYGRVCFSIVTIVACGMCGCGTRSGLPAPDAATLARRERLLLAREPNGSLPIAEVRELLKSKRSADDGTAEPSELGSDVVIVGRIGGAGSLGQELQTDYPWEKGRAAFMIASLDLDADDHAHTTNSGKECAFCVRKARNNSALVQFLGDDGEVLPIDARVLLDVKENQVVVIKGKAKLHDPIGLLTVTAEQVYVRPG